MSDVLHPTHHKISAMLPKKRAMFLLSGHSGYPQEYAISFGFTCLPAGAKSLHPWLLTKQFSSDMATKGMIVAYILRQRWCP